jgi:hypothetical protein
MEPRSTQANTLDALIEAVADHGLTLVIDKEWANTGTVYATDGLDAVGPSLAYRFDRGQVTFRWIDLAGMKQDPAASWATTGGTADFCCPTLRALVDRVAIILATAAR